MDRIRALLDFPRADGAGRERLAFGAPRAVLCAATLGEVRPALRAAQAYAGAGAWVVGFLAYDAAPAFDGAFRVRGGAGIPLAWFGVFDAPATAPDRPPPPPPVVAWEPDIGRARFDTDVASVRAAIGAGDVYQVNYTLRLQASAPLDALALFEQLRAAQPDGYLAYVDAGRWRLASASPELFFRREGDRITTMPMKGTAARGRWLEDDLAQAQWLAASEKNRAENLMIVDVLRNDLARIAVAGGVRVPRLFAVERHPTVLQMTSTVAAQLRPGTSLDEIFGALFPCASVTGAPKIKAVELIARLESAPRGAYCGAVGLLRPGGDAVFNVAIRSVVVDSQSGAASCGVGGGIVWDSRCDDEYAEALLKSRFLAGTGEAFALIETLRLQDGRFERLERHIARLSASARYFGRPFDEARCRAVLARVAGDGTQPRRVRVRLDRHGGLEADVDPMPAPPARPARFALARRPVDSASLWLYHKTTRRAVYERAAAEAPEAFDVLLWNERHELTEFTRGNVVLEMDSRALTPARRCGLLDGCLRAELIESGQIEESVLTLDDLARATRVWFVNSLRGRIEVVR